MLTDESLHGRIVLSRDGVVLGEVTHLVVDPAEWRVRAVEVRLRKDAAERIGAHHGFFRGTTIEIPTEQIQSIADAVILSVPIDALRREQAPEAPAQH